MPDQHIEMFLKWLPGGVAPSVNAWLADHGLSSSPMKNGLLVAGSSDRIEKAFGVSIEGQLRPLNIPVPAELKSYVEAITIPKPRQFYR